MMNRVPHIIDTTLRDGEQAPGVVFSLEEKIVIAHKLNQMGIREVEIGTPSISVDEEKDIKTLVSQGFSFISTGWARATLNDIEAVKRTGCDRINISFPVSKIQLAALGKDFNWVKTELKKMMAIATDNFDFVSVGAQDGSRASIEFLRDFIGEVIACGGKRIRIADTVGIMNPMSVHSLFNDIATLFPEIEKEFHAHNDLGMATANTIMALQSGANSASLTVNGLGERAGNAALEEVVAGLKYACDKPLAFDLRKMQELCSYVAVASNREIFPSKPITGKMVCSHESGIHCRSLIEDPLSYHAFNPEDIGRETNFFIGKHSGASSLVETFRAMGIHISLDRGRDMLPAVKQTASLKKTSLNKLELLKLFYES